MKKYFYILTLFLTIVALFLYLKPKNVRMSVNSWSEGDLNGRKVYLGFWTYGFWDDNTKSINPDKLIEVENEIGKKIAIANFFRGWEHLGEKDEINKELDTIFENGWTPLLSSNPYFFSKCQSTKPLYRAIAEGDCDSYLHEVGKALSNVKHKFFFRFAWEMNVDTMEWDIAKTGSTSADFVNAWKRFHNILVQESVTNAIWVFSPQIETKSTTPIEELYPGDDYVDWVALDGYNWGQTQTWSKWQSFYEIYFDSYTKLKKIAPLKPFMIAETNTTNVGGDQGSWYKEMLLNAIPNQFPDINAVVFFNEDKSSQEGVKWLIDNTPDSLEQFKASINNPIYTSTFE